MRDAVEASGRTVEEAIDAALERLGATEDEVEIRILAEGWIQGNVAEPARVRVGFRDELSPAEQAERRAASQEMPPDDGPAHTAPSDHAPRDHPPPARTPLDPEEAALVESQAQAAEEFLTGLFAVMDIDATPVRADSPSGILVEIEADEDDGGLIIGRHGATLDAVQLLTRAAVLTRTGSRATLSLEVEGYRTRRREIIRIQAAKVVDRVRKTGRAASLSPMTPFERKIVHEYVAESRGVRSSSAGEGPDRHVIIEKA